MDPAVLRDLQTRLAAMTDCLIKGADEWDRLRVSGGVLDVLGGGLVPETPAAKEIWGVAKKIHYEAIVDIFGADSAEVSAALHQTLTSPFASPVSSSPVLPFPQPTAMSKPGDAVKLQPTD